MRRPLVVPACAFAGGVVLAARSFLPPVPAAIAAALSLAFAALYVRRGARPWPAFALTALAVAAVGAAFFAAFTPSARRPLLALDFPSTPAAIRGAIIDEPASAPDVAAPGAQAEGYTTLACDVSHLRRDDGWQPVRGRVRVRIIGDATRLQRGDIIELSCTLAAFAPPLNPGGFDARTHWLQRGLVALARAPQVANARVVGRQATAIPIRAILAAKRAMRAYLSQRLPKPSAAMLQCLVLGDQQALLPSQAQNFRLTGTIHFLAISGLHVGLLAASVWLLLTFAGLGPRPTAVIVLIVTVAYAVLGGFHASILRAAVMGVAVCFGYIIHRRPDLLNTLALAAVIILVINPADILNPGFQLSFAAVVGMSLFSGSLRRFMAPRGALEERLASPTAWGLVRGYVRTYVIEGLAISLSATAMTLPLVAYSFHLVPLLTPLLNLLAAPLVWGMLLAGLPAVLLGPVVRGFAEPFLLIADGCTRALDWAMALLARLPGTYLYVASPRPLWIVVYFLALGLLLLAPRFHLRRRVAVMVILLLANVYFWASWRTLANRPDFTAINVGRGSATVVQLSDGSHILYDAGSATRSAVGERDVAPYLWNRGVRRLDVVIVSHGDMDHQNGILDVVDRFPVGMVLMPATMQRDPQAAALLQDLAERGTPLRYVSAGDVLRLGQATLTVLHPPRPPSPFDRLKPNDASLVVRVDEGTRRLLLPGDVQERGLAALLRDPEALRADILLAPHHGRPAANLEAFLNAVQPRVIVISNDVLEDVADYGPRGARMTGRDGAVRVSWREGKW